MTDEPGYRPFALVDRSPAPDLLVDCLDQWSQLSGIREARADSLAAVPRGATPLLDVGCGTAQHLAEWSTSTESPAAESLAVGVDASFHMLSQARRRHPGARVVQAHSHALPFRSGTFAAVRCERVLIHDPNPARAVAEMSRVVRPSGKVVLVEPDLEGVVLAHPEPRLTAELLTPWLRARFATPACGRALPALLAAAGLNPAPVVVRQQLCDFATADCVLEFLALATWARDRALVTAVQGRDWLRALETLDDASAFVCVVPIFIAAGTRSSN